MSTIGFSVCFLIALALLSAPALLYAKRKKWSLAALAALPFAPAVSLGVALETVNRPAQVGWGFVLYPFFCAILCSAGLYLLVFALSSLAASRLRSLLVLAAVCATAVVFGALVAPWHD